jgi:hypothetical protein
LALPPEPAPPFSPATPPLPALAPPDPATALPFPGPSEPQPVKKSVSAAAPKLQSTDLDAFQVRFVGLGSMTSFVDLSND